MADKNEIEDAVEVEATFSLTREFPEPGTYRNPNFPRV